MGIAMMLASCTKLVSPHSARAEFHRFFRRFAAGVVTLDARQFHRGFRVPVAGETGESAGSIFARPTQGLATGSIHHAMLCRSTCSC